MSVSSRTASRRPAAPGVAAEQPPRRAPRLTRTFQRRRFSAAVAAGGPHETLGLAFRAYLEEVLEAGQAVVDLGTGEGRAAFAAAERGGIVVGVDRDAAALERARRRPGGPGRAGVRFFKLDLEAAGFPRGDLRRRLGTPRGFDVALAHLCVSDRIVKIAAALLRPGGWAVVAALHSDHWYETGAGSRFAYDERGLRRALREAGLLPVKIDIETTELAFPSLDAVRDLYLGGERAPRLRRWREDGRWGRLQGRFRAGRRTLTTSTISALAQRPDPAARAAR